MVICLCTELELEKEKPQPEYIHVQGSRRCYSYSCYPSDPSLVEGILGIGGGGTQQVAPFNPFTAAALLAFDGVQCNTEQAVEEEDEEDE